MDIYSVSKRSGSKGKKSGNKGKRNTRRRVKRTKRMRTKRNSKRVSRRRNVKNVKRKSRRRVSRSRTKRVNRRRNRRVMRGGAGTRFETNRGEFYRYSAIGEDPVHTKCPYAQQIPRHYPDPLKQTGKWMCWRRSVEEGCPMCDGNTEDDIYDDNIESDKKRKGSDDLQQAFKDFKDPDSVKAVEDEFKRQDAELRASREAAQMKRQQSAAPPIEEPAPAPAVAGPTFKGMAQTVVAGKRFTNVWDSQLTTIEEIQGHINTLDDETAIDTMIDIPNLEKVRALAHFLSMKAYHTLDEQTKGFIVKLKAIATARHSCSKDNLKKRFASMELSEVEDEIKRVIHRIAISKGKRIQNIIINNINDFYPGDDIRERFFNFLDEEI